MRKKVITILMSFCLLFEQSGFAQVAGPLALPAFVGGLTAGDTFRPAHLRSMSYQPLEDNFKTILDKGSAKEKDRLKLEDSTRQLFNYFFIGLSLPNDSFWVNLRPDSADNIIDEYLAKTDIGKVMLEADVQLKKDTAKYTSPDTVEGRAYWDKLYRKAQELFENENITIPTLTRPWIVPDEIILRQSANNAYIYKATLKVMLEADYLKDNPEYKFDDPRMKVLNDYSSQLIRELVLPKLAKDVNTSKRYASLRQVYFSLILAQWFKNQVTCLSGRQAKSQGEYNILSSKIDSRDLKELTSKIQWSKDIYFLEYQRSFEEGEYNRQENVQGHFGLIVRQYFSGGVKFSGLIQSIMPGGNIQAKTAVNFFPGNTQTQIIDVDKEDPFKIEEIRAGASQSGGLPIVGNTNFPPGAPVSNFQDGGAAEKTEVTFDPSAYKELKSITSLDELRLALEEAPENSWLALDFDGTIVDHVGEGILPSNKFEPIRRIMKQRSLSPEEYREKQESLLKELTEECIYLEELALQAGIFKKVGKGKEEKNEVNNLLRKAKEKKVRVLIVTNRPPRLREVTLKILDSLNIKDYEEIIFAGFGNGKAQKIKDYIGQSPLDALYFADNNYDNVERFIDEFDRAKLRAFHLDRKDKDPDQDYPYYRNELEKALTGSIENSEEQSRGELVLLSTLAKISEFDKPGQAQRLKEIKDRLSAGKEFLSLRYAGEYINEIESYISLPDNGKQAPDTTAKAIKNLFGLDSLESSSAWENAAIRKINGYSIRTMGIPENSAGASPKAEGVELLKKELLDLEGFELKTVELLYNPQGRLIAVFPMLSQKMIDKHKDLSYRAESIHYLNLAYYYFELPQINDLDWVKKWQDIAEELKKDMLAINIYKEQVQANNIFKKQDGYDLWQINSGESPYVFAQLDKKSGKFEAREILEASEGEFKLRLDLLPSKASEDKFQLVVPVLPTVYSPGYHFGKDKDYYNLLSQKFNLEKGQNVLVVGPGVGLEAWIAANKTKSKVYAIGINPFEIANLKLTAQLAGFEVEAIAGDNIISEEAGPRFADQRFDRVIWNMPVYRPTSDEIFKPSGVQLYRFHDGDYRGLILKRFARGLTQVLAASGRAILWNERHLKYPENMDSSPDVVAEILKTAGQAETLDDESAKVFKVEAIHSQYSDTDTYFVSFAGQKISALDGGEGQQETGNLAKPGGIDLRDLKGSAAQTIKAKLKQENNFRSDKDLENEWNQIQELVNKGFLPESGRIKECLPYCKASKAPTARIESMLAGLADILRIEEDQNLPTDPYLKEFLILLESS